ncbi:MAG: ATP-binding protein [Clostridiales bacterium]|mgnify:FL=1|nr:ATP-binding protein [Clostridiales bacterium]
MIRDKAYFLAESELKRRKQDAENQAENYKEAAFSIKELSDADFERRRLAFKLVREKRAGRYDIKLIKQSEAAEKKFENLCKKYNIDLKKFEPRYNCEKCLDTGIYSGEMCECFRELYIENLKSLGGLTDKAAFKFSDNNPEKFGDEEAERLKLYFSFAKTVAVKFPDDIKVRCIMLYGNTGTGKSAMASAIANEVAEKGHSVLFMSAFEMVSLFLKYHISPVSEREELIDDILTAELLVIDDLGIEPKLNNVTLEYFLLLLTQRDKKGYLTVITTNIEPDKLHFRYQERIASRLNDRSFCSKKHIEGKDKRLIN